MSERIKEDVDLDAQIAAFNVVTKTLAGVCRESQIRILGSIAVLLDVRGDVVERLRNLL